MYRKRFSIITKILIFFAGIVVTLDGVSGIVFFYWYKKLYSYKIKTYSTCRCKYVFKIYYVKRIDIKYKYFIILHMDNIFYLITREQSAIS